MSQIKINFICFLCQKILKQPLSLNCLCKITICQEHTLKHLPLKCPKCSELIYNHDLNANKLLKYQLDTNEYLTLEEREFKQRQEKIIDEIQALNVQLVEKIREFSLYQANHFEAIRCDIDIRREILIQDFLKQNESLDNVYRESEDLIKQIEIVELEFRKNFQQNVQPYLVKINSDEQSQDLIELLRDPYLNIKSLNNFEKNLLKNLNQIRQNLTNFKLYEYDLVRNRFLKSEKNSIGKLELFNDFLTWSREQEILNVATCHMKSNDIEVLNFNTNSTIKRLQGHTNGVICLTLYSNDQLLSGSLDSTIKLWNLNSSECIHTFQGHTKTVNSLKILLNGHLASASDDKSLKIWHLKSYVCLYTLLGHTDWINCVDQLDNGLLLSAAEDRSVRVWDLEKRVCIQTLMGHQNWILCMRVLNEATHLFATSSVDKTIKIWNLEKCLETLKDHTGPVYDLEVTTVSNELISCSFDRTIRIWSLVTFACIKVLNYPVTCLKVNRLNGQLICSSYYDKSIRVWDMRTGGCLQALVTQKEIMKLEICPIV